MKIQKFEDLLIWQKAKEVALSIYREQGSIPCRRFGDQIRGSSLSIMNNIAEGFGRSSKKEFKYFLSVAKGSCSETMSMLYLGEDLKYFSKQYTTDLREKLVEISKMISALIRSLSA